MQVMGAVHKIETRPARGDFPERRVLILTDRNGPGLDAQAEELYFEVDLQGDGKGLKAGQMVTFWGRPTYYKNGKMGGACKDAYRFPPAAPPSALGTPRSPPHALTASHFPRFPLHVPNVGAALSAVGGSACGSPCGDHLPPGLRRA